MPELGQQLRAERENRGLRRVDVSRATHVYVHHLAALEYGNFRDLPDDRIVAGYVRVYADYLGIDADAAVREFLTWRGVEPSQIALVAPSPPVAQEVAGEDNVDDEEEVTPETNAAPPRRSAPWRVAAVGAVAVVLLAVAWWAWPSSSAPVPDTAGPTIPTAQPTPVATSQMLPVEVPEETAAELPVAPDRIEGRAPEPPTPEVEPLPVGSSIRVTAHGVGTGVVDHKLVGEGERFAAGSKVWFWTRIEDGTRGQAIEHVWLFDGRVVDRMRLTLGGSPWRTQSRKTLFRGLVGAWRVEVRDEAGHILARSAFACEP